ncbi:hypothetical protein PsYK624_138270 [Phanerochaete sordida]|uniref:Uncharacterized protein n=1 Tax=Phanerochaete sordida TaxID=48140 RepID=A0A9P3GMR7_9APHY|nr:hypothetical protein PsYK624_138270 [Phanerochaete sordida]
MKHSETTGEQEGPMPHLPDEVLEPILVDAVQGMTLVEALRLAHLGPRLMYLARPAIFRDTTIPAYHGGRAFQFSELPFGAESGLRPLVRQLRFNGRVSLSHRALPSDAVVNPEDVIHFCAKFPRLESVRLEALSCHIPFRFYIAAPTFPALNTVRTLSIDLNETTSAVDALVCFLPSATHVDDLTIRVTKEVDIPFCTLLSDPLMTKTLKASTLHLGHCTLDKTPLINRCLASSGPNVRCLTIDLAPVYADQYEEAPALHIDLGRNSEMRELIATVPFAPREWSGEAEASTRPLMRMLGTTPSTLERLVIVILSRPRNYVDLCGALTFFLLADIISTTTQRAPNLRTIEMSLDIDRAPDQGPAIEDIWQEAFRRMPGWHVPNARLDVRFT